MSNGRLVVGLGMGDLKDEFEQMGIALPSIRERQEMFGNDIDTIRLLAERVVPELRILQASPVA